jgi:hypothetical protein
MKRNAAELEGPAAATPSDRVPAEAVQVRAARLPPGDVLRYEHDLEQRYGAARDAWTHAMQAASSGRSADLASLAIAQQAYETVAAEREHWLASGQVAIPIQRTSNRHDIEVAIGQEEAWRRVHEHRPGGGLLARIRRRFGGG